MILKSILIVVIRQLIELMLFLVPILFVLALLEKFFSGYKINKTKKSLRIDMYFLLLITLYGPVLEKCATLFAAAFYLAGDFSSFSFSSIMEMPVLLQFFVILILRDSLVYLRHRLFHLEVFWPFHRVHHSPEDVNYLTNLRFHPVEAMIEVGLDLLLYFFLSPSPLALTMASFTIVINAFFIHSTCRVEYGPLRYVLVSPVLHRVHHSRDRAAAGKNLAAMFSFLDVLGGTFYMPKDYTKIQCGIGKSETLPERFLVQLTQPFVSFVEVIQKKMGVDTRSQK